MAKNSWQWIRLGILLGALLVPTLALAEGTASSKSAPQLKGWGWESTPANSPKAQPPSTVEAPTAGNAQLAQSPAPATGTSAGASNLTPQKAAAGTTATGNSGAAPAGSAPPAAGNGATAPNGTNGNDTASSQSNGSGSTRAAPAQAPTPPAVPPQAVEGLAPEPSLPLSIAQPLTLLQDDLTNAEKAIKRVAGDDDRLEQQRSKLEAFSGRADEIRSAVAPLLDKTKALLDKLGPAPAKDQPAESKTVAATRAQLTQRLTALEGAVKTTKLIEVRANQLISDIQVKRQELFTRDLLRKGNSPFTAAFWKEIADEVPVSVRQLKLLFGRWIDRAADYGIYLVLLIAATAGIWAYLKMLLETHVQARLTTNGAHRPGLGERITTLTSLMPARIAPYAAAALIFFGGLWLMGLLEPPMGTVLLALVKAVIITLLVFALARTVLAPARPKWRLVNLSNEVASKLFVIVILIAIVYCIDLVLSEFARALFQPLSIRIFVTFVCSLLLAGLLLAFAFLPLEAGWDPNEPVAADSANDAASQQGETDASGYRLGNAPAGLPPAATATAATASAPGALAASTARTGDAATSGETGDRAPASWSNTQILLLRGALGLTAAAIALSSALGYVALGRFIAQQAVVTGIILGIGILLHFSIQTFTDDISNGRQSASMIEKRMRIDPGKKSLLARMLAIFLNASLILALAPWVLLQWGFSGSDIIGWGRQALFGFTIGGYEISIARIAMGILLFAALLFATRYLQRWLDNNVFNRPNMDSGIANSIRTAVGYAGILVASLAAASYAGFNITNVALVAGALSVGIGFGLQSIVNNFVSGLILLVGRPIKVGDWIVAGSEEGYVRRISVRATEIETFDRATVIIPNSDLISGRVTNWTHRNTLGRLIVNIGVSYSADPEQVREILLRVAGENETVMRFPAPKVFFLDFGASSLDFSLRAYIADVNNRMTVSTELRMAIFKALKDANIEIPFPQQDIHLRDLDGVKGVMSQVIAERQRKQAMEEG